MANSSFPIIFEATKGDCKQPVNSSSFYNLVEVTAVMGYVDKILNGNWNGRKIHLSDIGIVSPYRGQCNIIRTQCQNKGFGGITVGTAEVFQGQERPVMIISTVRTGGKTLGFVKDKRVCKILNFDTWIIIIYFISFFLISANECNDHAGNLIINRSGRPPNTLY